MRGSRRKAREDAVQVLYQLDLNNTLTPGAALTHFESLYNPEGGPLDAFTRRLVTGVAESLVQIDATIAKYTEHWRKDRMAAVDRNIVRLGVYELEHCDDIPATVSINEMVELAKAFGSENSPAFVNGILDRVKAALDRPEKAK
jgi:transcription antitermination protein NusB